MDKLTKQQFVRAAYLEKQRKSYRKYLGVLAADILEEKAIKSLKSGSLCRQRKRI
jgi:hypothetical protein